MKCNSLMKIKRSQLKESNIWRNPIIKTIIVVICVLADTLTIFNIIETYITQSYVLSLIITIVCSGVMNISPVLIGIFLSEKSDQSLMKKFQIGSLATIFIILFCMTFSLRWVSSSDIFANNDVIVNIDDNLGNDNQKLETTLPQDVLAILLGIEPLATSLLCFALSYDNYPNRVRLNKLKKNNEKLNELIKNYQILIYDLEQDLERDLLNEDNKLYEIAVNEAQVRSQMQKNKARIMLATKLKTADSVSYLLEGDENNEVVK